MKGDIVVTTEFRCIRCSRPEQTELPIGATREQVDDWAKFWLCPACWLGCPRRMPVASEKGGEDEA